MFCLIYAQIGQVSFGLSLSLSVGLSLSLSVGLSLSLSVGLSLSRSASEKALPLMLLAQVKRTCKSCSKGSEDHHQHGIGSVCVCVCVADKSPRVLTNLFWRNPATERIWEMPLASILVEFGLKSVLLCIIPHKLLFSCKCSWSKNP